MTCPKTGGPAQWSVKMVKGKRGQPGVVLLSRNQRERIRRQYRPTHVRLLFIGESPPASGRFFYHADSGLYRAMREAFQAVDPSVTDASFLTVFQASGCYLVDLSLDPVDHLERTARRAACRAGEESLSRTIALLRPPTIVTVVRTIESIVIKAASRANWRGVMVHLPYPGRWSRPRQTFVETLAPLIAGCRG